MPPTGAVSLGWVSSDLNTAGVVGDAHLGTAEKGEAVAAHMVAGFVGLLRQVRDLGIEGYAPMTGPAVRIG